MDRSPSQASAPAPADGGYRRILLLASPTQQRTAAFDRAAALARDSGAHLHVYLADRDCGIAKSMFLHSVTGLHARDAFLEQRQQWLGEQIAALKAAGLTVTDQVSWASPNKAEMLDQIAEFAPDIVVKDVHHEPALRRLLLRPLDWQLLAECPVPLLLVSDHAADKARPVIAAVDIDRVEPQSIALRDKILLHARRLARPNAADVHVAYSFITPPAHLQGLHEIYDQVLQRDRQSFQALAQSNHIDEHRSHWLSGPPASQVNELARTLGADTLVIGFSHRPHPSPSGLGSTAEAIVEGGHCNLLSIKPD